MVCNGEKERLKGGVAFKGPLIFPNFKKNRLNQFFGFIFRLQVFEGKCIKLPGVFQIYLVKGIHITFAQFFNKFVVCWKNLHGLFVS